MPEFLILAFLFSIGSILGWGIEVVFRRFFSASNPERRWINPGFLIGPYLPLYGFSLCILYLLASLERYDIVTDPLLEKLLLFSFMAICVTILEFFTGLFCRDVLKVKLWDYSDMWGNISGIICPLFTFFWAILSSAYYFLVHPHILEALAWLSRNLVFSFVIGMYYGVFIIDLVYSAKLLPTIRKFAKEHDLTVKYEDLKSEVRKRREENTGKVKFFLYMIGAQPLSEHLHDYAEKLREQFPDLREELSNKSKK